MLTTSVERLEGAKVKLTVTVPAETVDDVIGQAYKALAKKYRFPGFRPGKAPRPILDQHLGQEYILAEATEALVNDTYGQAVDAEGLRPIASPEVSDLDSVVPGEAFTFVAEVQLRPELTVSSADAFEVEMPPKVASDEDIDIQIELARERFASLEPVEDRGVAEGDYVLLSFVGTVDGEGYEGNTVDQYLYEMNRGLMPAEFDAALIGAKAGDEVKASFEIPDTTSNPDFAGKTAGFDITVHEVKAKVLPEVDDEFASNVGGFDSVDEMRADVRMRVDQQKKIAFDRMLEEQIRLTLASRIEGDIPQAMVDSRKQQIGQDFNQMLDGRGMEFGDYLASTGQTPEQVDEDMAAQAKSSVAEELALEAFFRARNMEVTDADLNEEISVMATDADKTPEEARKRWEDLGLLPVIREQVMHRKAMQTLLAECTIKEIAPEAAAKSEAKGTKKSTAKKAPKKAAEEAAVEGDADETKE
ncbi:MAG TPA: trigger factor [Coriobacteriia bacterium]|nr:trigger factor [Coriobacteriia bacterium]